MFHTERLSIRKIVKEDIPDIYRGLSHPEVIKYYGISFDTLEATEEQMQWYADLETHGTGQWFAIFNKASAQFVGAGGFNDVSPIHKKGEFGFWLLPEYWGKGYMKEACSFLFDYAFQNLGLHRIEGYVEHENQKCIQAVSKVGFKYEGTMVDCEVKNGKFISINIYALLHNHKRSE